MKRHACRWAFVFILLPLLASISLAALTESAPPGARGESAHMSGTVRAVDTKAGRLDVITGVGHAMRLVRIQVAPACQIKVSGTKAQLGNVKPAMVVRVRYLFAPPTRQAPIRRVAVLIEALPIDAAGGGR